MKRFFLIVMLFATQTLWSQSQTDSMLCELGQRDQQVRYDLLRFQQTQNIDSLMFYAEKMVQVDAENQQVLASILKAEDIPEGLSDEAYNAIFLVVDHAELNYQKQYFRFLKRAAKKGKFSQSQINTLYDRILMRSNRRQLYGTQTMSNVLIVEGEKIPQQVNYVWPVRRASSVDKRRAKSGQGSMQDQCEAHKKLGYKVVWNRSLSVREFQKMISATE